MIWPCETNRSGAGMLLKDTETPAMVVDNGMLSAWARLAESSVPKIETREPGVTTWPGVKLAAF